MWYLGGVVAQAALSWGVANMGIDLSGSAYTLTPSAPGDYVNIANAALSDPSANGKFWATIAFPDAGETFAYAGFAPGSVSTAPAGQFASGVEAGFKREGGGIMVAQNGTEIVYLGEYKKSDIYELSYSNRSYYWWKNGSIVYTATVEQDVTSMNVRVASFNAAATVTAGTFSSYPSVTPTVTATTNTLSWFPVPDGVRYIYKIYSDEATSLLDLSGETTALSVSPTMPAVANYWVTLTAILSDGTSSTSAPTVFPFGVVGPEVVTSGETLLWDPIPEAVKYIYKIYSDEALTVLDLSGETTESSVSPSLVVGNYTATVTVVYASGATATSVTGFPYGIAALVVTATNDSLTWEPIPKVSKYIYNIYSDDALTVIDLSGETTATSVSPSLPVGNYWATVTAVFVGGATTTTIVSFPLGVVAPTITATVDTLSWSPISGATAYTYNIYSDETFTVVLATGETTGTSYVHSLPLGSYWAIVTAVFPLGTAASAPYNFTVSVLELELNPSGTAIVGVVSVPTGGVVKASDIPSTVTSISANAFAGQPITSVSLPNRITSIGATAFAGCPLLTSLKFPSSLTAVGMAAFQSTGLTTADLSGCPGLSILPEFSFYACGALQKVLLPSSVTLIGAGCFESCTALSNVNLSHITTIGINAFYNTGLTTIVTGALASMDIGAFSSCALLTDVSLNGTLTLIPESAFAMCYALQSITMPPTVQSIHPFAFSGCTSLILPNNSLPNSIVEIFYSAFSGYAGEILRLPSSLRYLGMNVFASAPNLTKIYFNGPRPALETPAFISGNPATYFYPTRLANADVGFGTWAALAAAGDYDPTPDYPDDANFSILSFSADSANYSLYGAGDKVFAFFNGNQTASIFTLFDAAGVALATTSAHTYYPSTNIDEVVFTGIASMPVRAFIDSNAVVPVRQALDVTALNSNGASDTRVTIQYVLPSEVPVGSTNITLTIRNAAGTVVATKTGRPGLNASGAPPLNHVAVLTMAAGSSLVPGQKYTVQLSHQGVTYQSMYIACAVKPAPPAVMSALRIGKQDLLSVANTELTYIALDVSKNEVFLPTVDANGSYVIRRGASFVQVDGSGNLSNPATYTVNEIVTAPQGLTRDVDDGVVFWNPVANAEAYNVYRMSVDGVTPVIGQNGPVELVQSDVGSFMIADIINATAAFTYKYRVAAVYAGYESFLSDPITVEASIATAADGSVQLDAFVANQLSTGSATSLLDAIKTYPDKFTNTVATATNVDATVLLSPVSGIEPTTLKNVSLVVPIFANGEATLPEVPSAGTVLYMYGSPGESRTLFISGGPALQVTFPENGTDIQIVTVNGDPVSLATGGIVQLGYDVFQYAGRGSAGLLVLPKTAIANILINDISYNVASMTVDVPAGPVTFNATPVNSYAAVSGLAASYDVPLGISVPVSFDVTFDDGAGNTVSETITYTLRGAGTGTPAAAPLVTSIAETSDDKIVLTLPTQNFSMYDYYALYDSASTTQLGVASPSRFFPGYLCVVFDAAGVPDVVRVRGYDLAGNYVSNYTLATATYAIDRDFAAPRPTKMRILPDGTVVAVEADLVDVSSAVVFDADGIFWGKAYAANDTAVVITRSGDGQLDVSSTAFSFGAFSDVTGSFTYTDVSGLPFLVADAPKLTSATLSVATVSESVARLTFTGLDEQIFPITEYRVWLTPDNGSPAIDVSSASLPMEVGGLSMGVAYSWTLQIVTVAGESPFYAAADTFMLALSAPSGIVLTPTATDVTIAWSPSPGATEYAYAISRVSDMKTIVQSGTVTESPVTVSGLIASTQYWVTVTAKSGAASATSTVRTFTTTAASSSLAAPALVSATPTTTSIALAWGAVQGATEYEYAIYGDSQYSTLVQKSTTTALTATVSGLLSGTTYYYAIKAKNGATLSMPTGGSVATLSASGGSLNPPMLLGATATESSITFSWGAVTGASSYAYEIHTNSQYTNEVRKGTVTSLTVTVTGLASGTTYYYRIMAKNASSQSSFAMGFIDTASGGGGGGGVVCFLGNAPVLTPSGYRRIDSLREGDEVQTADGRTVAIQRTVHQRVAASAAVNPYVIERGQFGATRRLLISPEHRVAVAGRGLVEARHLGLAQEERTGALDYYNLELPDWQKDNLVVAGVEVESLAPVRRIVVTQEAFRQLVARQYGAMTPAVQAKILRTCKFLPGGRVEVPAMRR